MKIIKENDWERVCSIFDDPVFVPLDIKRTKNKIIANVPKTWPNFKDVVFIIERHLTKIIFQYTSSFITGYFLGKIQALFAVYDEIPFEVKYDLTLPTEARLIQEQMMGYFHDQKLNVRPQYKLYDSFVLLWFTHKESFVTSLKLYTTKKHKGNFVWAKDGGLESDFAFDEPYVAGNYFYTEEFKSVIAPFITKAYPLFTASQMPHPELENQLRGELNKHLNGRNTFSKDWIPVTDAVWKKTFGSGIIYCKEVEEVDTQLQQFETGRKRVANEGEMIAFLQNHYFFPQTALKKFGEKMYALSYAWGDALTDKVDMNTLQGHNILSEMFISLVWIEYVGFAVTRLVAHGLDSFKDYTKLSLSQFKQLEEAILTKWEEPFKKNEKNPIPYTADDARLHRVSFYQNLHLIREWSAQNKETSKIANRVCEKLCVLSEKLIKQKPVLCPSDGQFKNWTYSKNVTSVHIKQSVSHNILPIDVADFHISHIYDGLACILQNTPFDLNVFNDKLKEYTGYVNNFQNFMKFGKKYKSNYMKMEHLFVLTNGVIGSQFLNRHPYEAFYCFSESLKHVTLSNRFYHRDPKGHLTNLLTAMFFKHLRGINYAFYRSGDAKRARHHIEKIKLILMELTPLLSSEKDRDALLAYIEEKFIEKFGSTQQKSEQLQKVS